MSATDPTKTPSDVINEFMKNYVEKNGEASARAVEAFLKTHITLRMLAATADELRASDQLKDNLHNALTQYSSYMLSQYCAVLDLSESAIEAIVKSCDELVDLLDNTFAAASAKPKIIVPTH